MKLFWEVLDFNLASQIKIPPVISHPWPYRHACPRRISTCIIVMNWCCMSAIADMKIVFIKMELKEILLESTWACTPSFCGQGPNTILGRNSSLATEKSLQLPTWKITALILSYTPCTTSGSTRVLGLRVLWVADGRCLGLERNNSCHCSGNASKVGSVYPHVN